MVAAEAPFREEVTQESRCYVPSSILISCTNVFKRKADGIVLRRACVLLSAFFVKWLRL